MEIETTLARMNSTNCMNNHGNNRDASEIN